ncbi:MAG: DUF3574 domain-containing protein [Actinobacteria bacterium]|nr:DUF3574 domain-containing protein [Actinomycetota bacterium]MBU1943244.1 DUF3574 domain-containing protein [Actinomycetota bacterium]MBU2685966.1 DUF3574 domain-containing protein [Actinomycetota bacterium]
MRTRRSLPVVLLVPVLAAVVLVAASGCGGSGTDAEKTAFVQTELYLGLEIPAGGQVSGEQFATFLDEVVTPAFPAGLTVFDSYGQMRQSDGKIVRQTTKVLLLVHEDTKANSDAVSKLISSYRSRFENPQVMHTTQAVEPEFFGN